MRRRRPRLRVILAWLALVALPLGLCLALSWALSLQHFRSEALSLAEANARRVEDILRTGDRALAMLAKATGGQCSPRSVKTMGHAVFHGVYFREAGIERDGNLACTSVEMLPPGFDIPNASRKPAARVGKMEILSPAKTIRGGKSLILNLPLDGARGHYINLLVDPQVLVETAHYYEGMEASTYLDDAPNGELLRMGLRPPPEMLSTLRAPLQPGIHRVEGGLYAVARAGEYPFYTVMSVGESAIAKHWRTQMRPAAIAGFLLSGLALLVLRRALPRHDAAQDLQEGIAAGEITVAYQPIVDARSRRIIGAEALARWQHPRRGLVMPDEFVPLAESHGLISSLSEGVLVQVRQDLQRLAPLPAGFYVSVNLSRAQLTDRRLLETLDGLFGPGHTLGSLCFEITERELLANVAEVARGVIQSLRERGAIVCLDDFGTGYSGLSHLRHFPLHDIKIDGSFVRALDTEAVTASLVESIVALAKPLELGLVAEGVETEAQRARLLALGVTRQQGWLYARAMSADELKFRLAGGP
jgi:sensor c-di-GMP phosphodiesterase-like protein